MRLPFFAALVPRLALFALSCVFLACAQQAPHAPPDAQAIMAQVAANQDRSEAERAHYLYVQHARVQSRKGKVVACEEITDTRITPGEKSFSRKLLKLDGRVHTRHGYESYHELPAKRGATDVEGSHESVTMQMESDGTMDRDLVENMRDGVTEDKSRDGINRKLFPLTTATQKLYDFVLAGTEPINGRQTWHLRFTPKDKDDYGWKGDAYIDTTDFEPVVVRTTQARKLPFAVRTLLGTSLPGLGFTVVYAPQPGGVWFPVSFGTEFKLHVLFFYNREVTVAVENRDFERTHADMKLVDPDTPVASRN